MFVLKNDSGQFQVFEDDVNGIINNLAQNAKKDDIVGLEKLVANFRIKTGDFFRENRKLNIGVVGQVKAGKSSFLNTLLFDGKEILPKASTPKTATLTKMEYSEHNIIDIEYYSLEEWEVLKDNAEVDLEDEVYTSAKEIVGMVRRNGINPQPFLEKGKEQIEFGTYTDLVAQLNDYVGEDGKYTPIVKAVTLYLNKEEFKGLSIVDTPGLNDPIASRTIRTKEFMEVCDVVFFLSQSGCFLDKSDWILLSSQLPQKGVKKLVLLASKYDSGVRDVLRITDNDDVFGDDDNIAENIPKACSIIKKKLRKRAKSKVEEFAKDLELRSSTPELIALIKQCSEPILVSSLAHNMSKKSLESYTAEEKNVYFALKQFSEDMESDLRLLGNFEEVKQVFTGVVAEKEAILEKKAKSFVPTAITELKALLESYKEKAKKRLSVLEDNDREQLLEQKKLVETQIGSIKGDISVVFGEVGAKLETEKANGIRELREASKDYLDIKERTGSVTRHRTYTSGHFFWKKTHQYQYEEHYSYCIAADVIENLRKYSIDAVNQVEEIFTDTLQLKELKRKLLNVVLNNFDMGSEKFDASLIKITLEETINAIEFPVFNLDISDAMNGITGRFTGELTSAREKTELSTALYHAISKINDELCNKLTLEVKRFKVEMNDIGRNLQDSLLENVNKEYETLLVQYDHKEKEISEYKSYIVAIDLEIFKL